MATLEGIILVVNCCVLALAIMDEIEDNNENVRAVFGEIIIYSSMVFSMSAIVFVAIKLIVGIQNIRK